MNPQRNDCKGLTGNRQAFFIAKFHPTRIHHFL